MSNAVVRAANVSLTSNVPPSAVIAIPFGLTRPSAATLAHPSGSTRISTVSRIRSSLSSSQPKLPT